MIVKYSELKPRLQTGDLFLFDSNYWLSDIIKQLTDTVFSHVGMVVNHPGVGVCFLEATTETNLACHAGTELDKKDSFHSGVHLVLLDELLQYYAPYVNGVFVCRQLHTDRTKDMLEALESFITTRDGRPFDSYFEMLAHWFEGLVSPIAASEKEYDCAQLIAAAYQQLGLLPLYRPASAYSPANFSMKNRDLPLLSDATLSEEILVTWDGPTASEK